MSDLKANLKEAAEKLNQGPKDLRERLADCFNYSLSHLSEYDFVETKRDRFRKIQDQLTAVEPKRFSTRAEESAQKLTLEEATALAAEIIELSK